VSVVWWPGMLRPQVRRPRRVWPDDTRRQSHNQTDGLSQSINDFYTFILTSPLIDQLSEYNIPGGTTIGHGSLLRSKALTTDPANPIDDSAIRTALQGWIANDTDFPQTNANSVYFIYFPPGTTITLQGDSSCQSLGGYHESF
jgi:hypothetical protein